MEEEKKNTFERKIQPILTYVGAIGATLMSIMYIVAVFILIIGFKAQSISSTVIFAVVNAIVGLIIMQFLKIQGVSFAKTLPKNKKVLDEYYNTKTKDKKLHSITFYWVTSCVKDILLKGIGVIISTVGVIYIVIQGCNDYNLLLLALVNLVMFICFGLLALNKAYDFYNNRHIPYIIDQINKEKENDNNRQPSIEESRGTSSQE